MQTLDSSEDTDLELMFAEIRRYPLLTADEEKDIDSKKWDAVFELTSVIAEVDQRSMICGARCQIFYTMRQSVRQR